MGSFPNWASDETDTLADRLIATLLATPMEDPAKLWHNKYMLF